MKVDFSPHNPPQNVRDAKSSPMKEVGEPRVSISVVYMTRDSKKVVYMIWKLKVWEI